MSGEMKQPGTTPSPKKDKRTSFYLYLMVLFGAAFLMLLLAYFIQQRNSASALDDLRSSSTATRQELLENIEALEEEKQALEQELKSQEEALESLQTRFDSLQEQHTQETIDHRNQAASWADVWALEQSFQAKDYQACVEFFLSTPAGYTYTTPESAEERVNEIFHALVEKGLLSYEEIPLPGRHVPQN